jgi:hypothetical protein
MNAVEQAIKEAMREGWKPVDLDIEHGFRHLEVSLGRHYKTMNYSVRRGDGKTTTIRAAGNVRLVTSSTTSWMVRTRRTSSEYY